MHLELKCAVRCTDGMFGELADVVIDPVERRVTHLVVEPHHRHDLARLVPVELATPEADPPPTIALSCTIEEARRLPNVEDFAFVRLDAFRPDPDWDVGVENVLVQPSPYEMPGIPVYAIDPDPRASITYDRVPKGEVEIRSASDVFSADGRRLGHVDGVIVDDDEAITHIVLERGHVFRRTVTIPIDAVKRVGNDSITLRLTKDEVGRLPVIDASPRAA
jgi:sporulation protein YlmC with PRC-barrel domain